MRKHERRDDELKNPLVGQFLAAAPAAFVVSFILPILSIHVNLFWKLRASSITSRCIFIALKSGSARKP